MAIYNRFGIKVKKVVGGDWDKAEIDVVLEGSEEIRQHWIGDYHANGGAEEIKQAIEEATA